MPFSAGVLPPVKLHSGCDSNTTDAVDGPLRKLDLNLVLVPVDLRVRQMNWQIDDPHFRRKWMRRTGV